MNYQCIFCNFNILKQARAHFFAHSQNNSKYYCLTLALLSNVSNLLPHS